METLQLGIFAALLQFAGYAFYGSKILKRDIRPNAISWLMFAYGTALLLLIEWDQDASFALLALPAACALSSIFVAMWALRDSNAWWPDHSLEWTSFVLDVLLTLTYAATWIFLSKEVINLAEKEWAETFILICINIVTFTSFYPLLRQVYYHPYTEHSTPWVIWTLAYFTLALITISEEGIISVLLLYPMTNIALHGFIALHTAYWRYRHNRSIA